MAQEGEVGRGEEEASTSSRQDNLFREGYSIIKPLMLDNFKFTQWKVRMKAFVMVHDMEGWIIICKGLNVPTNEEGWNEKHLKLIQANSKAMDMLYCVMIEEDFKNISTSSMAKELWEKLKEMYGERREEEQIEENQCSTNDKAKYEESSETNP